MPPPSHLIDTRPPARRALPPVLAPSGLPPPIAQLPNAAAPPRASIPCKSSRRVTTFALIIGLLLLLSETRLYVARRGPQSLRGSSRARAAAQRRARRPGADRIASRAACRPARSVAREYARASPCTGSRAIRRTP